MDSLIELHAEGAWHPAARMTTSARGLRFEYLTDYVFGTGTWPVALSLPVDMTIVSTPLDAPATPLAFLWDLVPHGRGRRHLATLLGVQEHDPRSEELRVGKACVLTCSFRWSPSTSKQKTNTANKE